MTPQNRRDLYRLVLALTIVIALFFVALWDLSQWDATGPIVITSPGTIVPVSTGGAFTPPPTPIVPTPAPIVPTPAPIVPTPAPPKAPYSPPKQPPSHPVRPVPVGGVVYIAPTRKSGGNAVLPRFQPPPAVKPRHITVKHCKKKVRHKKHHKHHHRHKKHKKHC